MGIPPRREAFYETIKEDIFVISYGNEGFVKSSRCKARKN
jgi:hypothetical protein